MTIVTERVALLIPMVLLFSTAALAESTALSRRTRRQELRSRLAGEEAERRR